MIVDHQLRADEILNIPSISTKNVPLCLYKCCKVHLKFLRVCNPPWKLSKSLKCKNGAWDLELFHFHCYWNTFCSKIATIFVVHNGTHFQPGVLNLKLDLSSWSFPLIFHSKVIKSWTLLFLNVYALCPFVGVVALMTLVVWVKRSQGKYSKRMTSLTCIAREWC